MNELAAGSWRQAAGRVFAVSRRLSAAILLWLVPPLRAQVDPTGHWRTFETAHFNVHVREEYRELGPRAAGEAEAAWVALAKLLPAPGRRIEIVVADNVDDPNGYASTYPVPRIVIYALPPAGDIQLEAYDRWLRLVITHELAHIFHLDFARGWWSVGRSLLGRAPFLFPNQYTPPWMREGLAVFYESRLTGAGRLGGAFFRAIVDAAEAEEGALPLDAANTPTPRWPSGLRAYAFGSAFMAGAAAERGDSTVARFAVALARQPIPYLGLGAAWHRAAGVGLGAAWREAQAAAPPAGPVARSAGPGPSALPGRLRAAVPPRISPDGRYVALAHNDGKDATRLLVLDRNQPLAPDSAPRWRSVARLNSAGGLAWLPDGRVLVSQLEYTDPYTLRSDLWAIAMDGRAQQVTIGQRLRDPDVARDGAIVAVRAVAGGSEVVLIGGADGAASDAPGRIRVVAAGEPGVEYASPRFDETGETIVVVRVEGGWHDLRLIDRAGVTVRDLTHDSVPDLHPAFSPDGRWLTWSREVDGRPQIVGLRLHEGGAAVRLTNEPWAAYAPAPMNADTFYYLAYHADGFQLARASFADAALLTLPAPEGAHLVAAGPLAEIRREKGYSPLPSLLPQFWIPQAFVEPGGSWIGALSSGSDVLDRHAWTVSLSAGLGTLRRRVAGSAGYVFNGLRNVQLDVSWFHHPELFATVQNGPGGGSILVTQCCDPNDAWHAGVSILRRRVRTQASVRFGIEETLDQVAERRGISVSAQVAHTITPPLAISVQDGWRVGLTVRHRERGSNGLQSTEATLRTAAYFSSTSGQFARQVFAVRAAFGTVAGSDPVEFSIGGVSTGSLDIIPGVTLGGSARTFQVRGYAPGALTGRRAIAVSLENRVPVALVGRGIGMLPLGLDRLSASLFTDAALAWGHAGCPAFQPGGGAGSGSLCASGIWSVGAEMTADLALGYDFPVRLRAGGALRVTENGQPGGYVALGSSF